jgi:hypothetical protein
MCGLEDALRREMGSPAKVEDPLWVQVQLRVCSKRVSSAVALQSNCWYVVHWMDLVLRMIEMTLMNAILGRKAS